MDGEHKVVALQARFDSELHDSPPSGDRAPAPPMVGKSPADEQPVTFQDFYAYMPAHQYLYIPTGEMWPKDSVNGRLPEVFVGGGKPMKPSAWLDQTRPVEQVTWAPGEPNMIEGRLVAGGGGWIDRAGARCLNLYR